MRKSILFFLLIFSILSCGPKKVTPEIFLIPAGYRGMVKIFYNQPCGEKEVFEGKKRVYNIPPSGVLITQFKQELGIIHQEFYFVDEKGNRTPITELEMADFNQDDSTKHFEKEPPRDKLGVFFGFTCLIDRDATEKVPCYGFYVGSFTEVRYSWMDNYAYEHPRDSMERAVLEKCKGK